MIGLLKLQKYLLKKRKWLNIFLIILSVFYVLSLYLFDKVTILINFTDTNKYNLKVQGDVLDIITLQNYSRSVDLNNKEFINFNFPLRSKVLNIDLNIGDTIFIKSFNLKYLNLDSINILEANNNCYMCEMTENNYGLNIKALSENSYLENIDYIANFPITLKLIHYYFRYFPYLLIFLFLFRYLIIPLKPDQLIIKTVTFTFILLSIILLSFNYLRGLLPPPHISTEKGISLSQYNGISEIADNLLYIFIVITPYFIYLILKFINHPKEK